MRAHQIVVKRESNGWLCGPDRCSIWRIPTNWEALTLVCDYNWDGHVEIGDFVAKITNFPDGRARFIAKPSPQPALSSASFSRAPE